MKHIANKTRIWEIDFLRGIALILMICFHVIVDLRDFYHFDIDYLNSHWYFIGKISGILFIFISGISCTLSKNPVRRGIKVLLLGFLITVITFFIDDKLYIKFGILHFLGISMIISSFFINRKLVSILILGTIIILLELVFKEINMHTEYLFPLGLKSLDFTAWDYYPMIPWFGVYLYGIFTGKAFYKDKKGLIKVYYREPISYIGRNSLIIYLLHQPLILGILYLFLNKPQF